jgi:hypothetical protein
VDEIRIQGVRPYDGSYPLDWDSGITTREWRWLKQHAGYKPATLRQGMEDADPDLLVVFAVIALHRAGRLDPADVPGFVSRLDDIDPVAAVSYHAGDEQEEADGSPPPPSSSSASTSISGAGSPTSSANQGNGQSRTGIPASAISPSVPPTSLT